MLSPLSVRASELHCDEGSRYIGGLDSWANGCHPVIDNGARRRSGQSEINGVGEGIR